MPNAYVDSLDGNSWLDVGENSIISYDLENIHGDGAWTASRTNAFEAAAQTWENIADITFVELGGNSDWDMNWADPLTMVTETGTLGTSAMEVPDSARNRDGLFNTTTSFMDSGGLLVGGRGFQEMIEAMGRGLGLAQPHNNILGTTTFPGVVNASSLGTNFLNETRYTIMSGNNETDNANDDHGNIATPMAFDIATIQEQYGANTTYNSGNNTYFLNDNSDWSSIWDTGGVDMIDYTGSSNAQLDLRSATLSPGGNAGGFISKSNGPNATGGYTIAGDYTNALANEGTETGVIIENASGGSGNDVISGNNVDNALYGNSGNDVMKGHGGNDDLYGSFGNDNLSGGSGHDTIYGGNGNDTIDGGSGLDTMDGGFGTDTLDVTFYNAEYNWSMASGDTNFAGETAVNFENADLGDGENDVYGTDGANHIRTNGGNDVLKGLGGNDHLEGGDGNDIINGGTGNDIMEGGAGHDIYYVDNANDTTVESANEGYDRIYVDGVSTWTLASNMERLTFTDSGNHVGYGNEGSNRMEGNEGNDRFVIDGGGSDIYSGGQGTDTYDARSSDIGVRVYLNNQTLNGGAALDETFVSMEIVAGADKPGSVASGAGDIMRAGPGRASFAGYNGDDLLIGANNHDQLNGGHGNDRLIGGSGRDTLIGGEGNDLMTGGNDLDQFRFISSNFGQDTITDFQDNLDKLRFFSAVADDFNDFTITGNGTSTVTVSLDADPTNFITVNGIGGSNLNIDAGDIWFY